MWNTFRIKQEVKNNQSPEQSPNLWALVSSCTPQLAVCSETAALTFTSNHQGAARVSHLLPVTPPNEHLRLHLRVT